MFGQVVQKILQCKDGTVVLLLQIPKRMVHPDEVKVYCNLISGVAIAMAT